MSDENEFHPSINIGGQALQKGEVRNGKQLIAWDCIQDCVPNSCPIGSKCMYASQSAESGQCALQQQYIQSFVDTIFSTYRYIDEGDMFKIGMHLVPLYSQLCKQKILEKSLGYVAYEDLKGVTRIHPIYKEMRETMKVITLIWKDLGFEAVMNPSIPEPTGTKSTYVNGRSGFGDPEHYKRITADANNKRNVVR